MSTPRDDGAERAWTRKDFLVTLPIGALAAGFVLRGRGGGGVDHASVAPSMGLTRSGGRHGPPIGVQLYTLRSIMGDDLEGTLEALGEIGYAEVELAGLWGRTPAEFRGLLDGSGLRAASSHHSLEEVRGRWDEVLDGAAELGQSWVVVPSINGNERNVDGLLAIADDFNAAGEAARARGMGFGYHNHAWEFEPLGDGTLPLDLLLERTDPDLVSFQLDLFWAVHGGADPMEYFGAHPGRFSSFHVKDRTADGTMVAVGEGVIDFGSIFQQSAQAGVEHYFVEHDNPQGDPLENVRISFETLHGILG
jgi:sugar phosphate isomerase/epimerase